MLARQRNRRVVEEFDRLRFLTAVTDARAEEGEHLAPRPIGEGVEQAHIVCVVEGHPPLLAVQENAEPLRGGAELQPGPGLGAGEVLVPVTQPQSPVAAFWTQLDPRVSVHGLRGHAQVPFGFGAHFYLPVVAPRVEALGSQNVNALEEALAVFRVPCHALAFDHQSFIPGDSDARVSCVNIKR